MRAKRAEAKLEGQSNWESVYRSLLLTHGRLVDNYHALEDQHKSAARMVDEIETARSKEVGELQGKLVKQARIISTLQELVTATNGAAVAAIEVQLVQMQLVELGVMGVKVDDGGDSES